MLSIIQFINLLISGVKDVFFLIQRIPYVISLSMGFIPAYLAGVLLICLGVIILVRVLELLP